MSYPILAHAGGIDEMGIIVLPAVTIFGTWMLTRRRNGTATKPSYPVPLDSSSSPSHAGAPVTRPGWSQAADRSTAWTRPG